MFWYINKLGFTKANALKKARAFTRIKKTSILTKKEELQAEIGNCTHGGFGKITVLIYPKIEINFK